MPAHDGTVTDRIVDLTLRAVRREVLPGKHELAAQYGVHWRTIHRTVTAIERRVPVRWDDVATDRPRRQTRRGLGLARGGM